MVYGQPDSAPDARRSILPHARMVRTVSIRMDKRIHNHRSAAAAGLQCALAARGAKREPQRARTRRGARRGLVTDSRASFSARTEAESVYERALGRNRHA